MVLGRRDRCGALQALESDLVYVPLVDFSPGSIAVNTLLVSKDGMVEGGTNIFWLPRLPTTLC